MHRHLVLENDTYKTNMDRLAEAAVASLYDLLAGHLSFCGLACLPLVHSCHRKIVQTFALFPE